jgi:hypothetical protein
MTKAAELAKMGEVLTNSQIGGRRNIIINGAMQVAQRGTSATGLGASSSYPTLDRFKLVNDSSNSGRLTMTQDSSGPNGFANSLKLDCTTADTSIGSAEVALLRYSFEGQDVQQFKKGTSDAEKVTVSFFVKGNASATYTCELQDNTNGRTIAQEFSVTTSFTRIILTFNADTTGTITDDNAERFRFHIFLHGGSNYTGGTFVSNTWASTTTNQRIGDNQTSFFDSTDRTFFITGLQMEVGSQATPFEHRSFGEELALCQRYYYVLGEGNGERMGTGGYYSSSGMQFPVRHPVEMRATPSAEVVSGTGYYTTNGASSDAHNSITIDGPTKRSTSFYNSSEASGTSGDHAIFLTANASAKVALLSEL